MRYASVVVLLTYLSMLRTQRLASLEFHPFIRFLCNCFGK